MRSTLNGEKKRNSKKKPIAIIVVAAIFAAGAAAYTIWPKTSSEPGQNGIVGKDGVTRYYSFLTGLETTPEKSRNLVTGVMIENSPDARPQAGLNEAGVVFEAVAEGGITRFLALYQEAEPELICPVRSARAYYLEWSAAFGANVAHVGGSGDALVMLSTGNFGEDLDQSFHPTYFWREPSRPPVHDVCTTMAKLHDLEKALNAPSPKLTPMLRKDAEPVAEPNATEITIPLAQGTFEPTFKYNAENNNYLRFQGGVPHLDYSKQQIAPDVVIAMEVDILLRSDNLHNDIKTTGLENSFLIFQNGTVERGIWYRGDDHSPFRFVGADGKDIALNRGKTWITTINDISSVSY